MVKVASRCLEYACLGYKTTPLLWFTASLPHSGGIRTSILLDFTRPALCSYLALLTIEPMLGRNLAIALLFGLTATAVPLARTTKTTSTSLATTTSSVLASVTSNSVFPSSVNPTSEVGGTAAGTHGNTAIPPSETVSPAPEFDNPPLWEQFQSGGPPQPIRGDGAGAFLLGAQ